MDLQLCVQTRGHSDVCILTEANWGSSTSSFRAAVSCSVDELQRNQWMTVRPPPPTTTTAGFPLHRCCCQQPPFPAWAEVERLGSSVVQLPGSAVRVITIQLQPVYTVATAACRRTSPSAAQMFLEDLRDQKTFQASWSVFLLTSENVFSLFIYSQLGAFMGLVMLLLQVITAPWSRTRVEKRKGQYLISCDTIFQKKNLLGWK